jgi:pimeloyl-ACP methyl ester carboxylesterase
MSLVDYLTIAMFGAGAIATLSVGFSWVFARLYCKPKRCLPTKTPANYGLPFVPITFRSHGVPLQGWFIPLDGNAANPPTVILAHGWSNNAAQMLPVACALHQAGFGILLYDARGHGASGDDGPITILKIAEDLIAAVDYLAGRPDVDMTRLGAVGHSLGGGSVILAASIKPRIRAVVSTSAFADPVALTWGFMRALHIPRWPFLWLVCRFIERWLGATMADAAPRNRIGQVTAPLLLIHGESDQFIPYSNMEILYERAHREQAQRWLIPGRGHSDIIRDPRYGLQIVDFLREHLSLERVKQYGTSQII